MIKRLTFLLALTLPATVAWGGARKIPLYDLSTPEDTLKHAKKFKFTLEGKPKSYPRRVAIGSFHARYVFKHQETNRGGGKVTSVTTTTLQFDDATYATITSALYEQLKERLEAEGFEVVPLEEVTASAAYQALDGDGDSRENDRRAVHVPTGMKNIGVKGSGPAKQGRLAALNDELGTDAIVTGFVNLGICDVEPTKKTDMRAGIYTCLRGNLAQSGFDVRFIGGNKGSADKPRPAWVARVHKQTEMYEYNKRDKLAYDMALIARYSAAGAVKKKGFWGGWGLQSDQEDFVGGAVEVYDDALAMAFERWEDKHGKARERAGLTRTDPPDAFARVLGLDAPPASAPPAPAEVSITGESTCWSGTSTNGDLVLRRTVNAESSTMYEEQLTKLATGDYTSVAMWTVSRSAEDAPYRAVIEDTAGAWSATATFTSQDWASSSYTLTGELTAAKAPFEATYEVDGDSMTSATDIKVGKNVTTVTSELARAEDAACVEAFGN